MAKPPSSNHIGRILPLLGLACPTGLMLIIILMRTGLFNFHDDFTGYKGLGFFLLWALTLLPTGLLSAAAGLYFNRRSRLAIAAVIINLGLLLFGLFNLR